jgi:hypothetical protein
MRRAWLGVAVAGSLLAGCAPRPMVLAPVGGGGRRSLYLSARLLREQRAAMVETQLTVWPRAIVPCDTCPARRLPAFQADVALARPDEVRLRVVSLFGIALDLGVAGDSITAYVPARHWLFSLDAVRDSLGLDDPGRIAVWALAATWSPPDSAWTGTEEDGSLRLLRWCEANGDSVALAVDPRGTPARVRFVRADGRGVEVRYGRWESLDGVLWPVGLEVRDAAGAYDLAARLDRVRVGARRDSVRLAVHVPVGAEALGPGALRNLIEGLGSLP